MLKLLTKETIYWEPNFDKCKNNKGVKKVSTQDENNIIRILKRLFETHGSFCFQRVQLESGIGLKDGNITVRRILDKNGYVYYSCQKKSALLQKS